MGKTNIQVMFLYIFSGSTYYINTNLLQICVLFCELVSSCEICINLYGFIDDRIKLSLLNLENILKNKTTLC